MTGYNTYRLEPGKLLGVRLGVASISPDIRPTSPDLELT
jgi:hypothetical protein